MTVEAAPSEPPPAEPAQQEKVVTPAEVNPWNLEKPYSYSGLWFSAKRCTEVIYRKITGNPEMHWLPYAIGKYLAPAVGLEPSPKPRSEYRCLLLGSSEGGMERELCGRGFTGEILATDIAEKALARAKAQIDQLGFRNVSYVQADLNTATIEGPFDYIVAEGVLHHVENQEHCLPMLQRALAPDGVFVMVEHHAPVRFQLPPLQLRWINAALNAMPKTLRPYPRSAEDLYPPSIAEASKLFYVPPSIEDMLRYDPSEAIGGQKLKQMLPQIFAVIERTGYGGPILSYMAPHFDFERTNHDPFALAWLDVLIHIEETLIQTGILEDEFIFWVVKNKRSS